MKEQKVIGYIFPLLFPETYLLLPATGFEPFLYCLLLAYVLKQVIDKYFQYSISLIK